jgi:hypothetical protein
MGRLITVEVSDMQGRIVERLAEVYGCSCADVLRSGIAGVAARRAGYLHPEHPEGDVWAVAIPLLVQVDPLDLVDALAEGD